MSCRSASSSRKRSESRCVSTIPFRQRSHIARCTPRRPAGARAPAPFPSHRRSRPRSAMGPQPLCLMVSPPDRRPRRLLHQIFGGIEHIAPAPVGRLLPRPRKERLASAIIAAAVASVACTNSGGTMLGSLWAHPNSTSSCRARYWSESPGGTCTHRKAPPCHDAPPFRSFA